MVVQGVEMDSVPTKAVAQNQNDFLAFALQAALLDTTILATKAVVVLSLRMIADVSAWNAAQHDKCITNGGFPFPKLCVVRKPEPENKDASETEDDNEVDGSGGVNDEEGEDGDDVSGDESEDDDDSEDGPDANGDGGSEDEDEEDGEEEYEDGEDEDEDDEEEEEDEEVPQPPAKKRK